MVCRERPRLENIISATRSCCIVAGLFIRDAPCGDVGSWVIKATVLRNERWYDACSGCDHLLGADPPRAVDPVG